MSDKSVQVRLRMFAEHLPSISQPVQLPCNQLQLVTECPKESHSEPSCLQYSNSVLKLTPYHANCRFVSPDPNPNHHMLMNSFIEVKTARPVIKHK